MKQKDILLILGTSCLIVIIWIIFSVIHTANTSKINQSLTGEIVPIQPDFDTQTIMNLKKREQTTPIFQITTASQSSSTSIIQSSPTPSLPVTKTSTQAATPL